MRDGRSEALWRPLAAIAGLALVLALPGILGPVRLHDSFWIDWVWVDQFGEQLRQGHLYPRWLPASHDGLGAPVFYYYPPLAFYPAGLLRALGVPTYAAIVATFALAFAAAGAAMYAWACDISSRPLPAALLFMAAPYTIADVYGRGALAEVCAIALIPLVALGMRRIAEGRGMALLVISYAALIGTHLPLALLVSLLLIAPYGLVLTRGRPRMLRAFAAPLTLGLGLAAAYLVPALALERYRDAAMLWADPLLQPGHWLLSNRTPPLDGMRLITLKTIAVVALPAAFMAWRWRLPWAGYALAICLVVAGLLPFFWDLPLVRSVQFPFRALPLAEFGLAAAFATAPDKRLAALLLAPALALSATFLLAPPPDEAPVPLAELAARHPDVPENLPPGPRPYSWPSRWALDLAARHRTPVSQGDVTIEPAFYFPAWRVACAGAPVATFPDPATGLLAHRGTRCSLAFGWTAAEVIGALASALSLALLAASLIFRRRARRDARC